MGKHADAEYHREGKHICIKLPKKLIGVEGEDFELEFKWSDNMQSRDVMDFYVNGDSAPMGRLNYIYRYGK